MLCTIKYKLPFHIIQASVTWYRDYNPGLSVHEQFFSPYMLHSNMNRLFTDNGVGSWISSGSLPSPAAQFLQPSYAGLTKRLIG